MPYEIEDRLRLKIYFDDEEFPFERLNSLDMLHISCSTRIGVPMLHMRLQDSTEFFANTKFLADGTKITLVIQPWTEPVSDTYIFRMNSYKKPLNATGSGYEFDAYLDVPIYWHASQTKPIEKTSAGAIEEIASLCGMTSKVKPTVDRQLWLPRNLPYFEWARQISERGYRSERSCMQLGITPKKNLRYLDMQDPPAPVAKFLFPDPRAGYIYTTDFIPQAKTGSANHQTNYRETRIEQDLLAANLNPVHKQVQIRKLNPGKLLVSSKIRGVVPQAKVRYAPIDPGNVHPYYERALYQNRRLSNVFLNRIDIITPERTALSVLDYVNLTLDLSTTYSPKLFNLDYWITSHAIYIHANNYYEKFELASNVIKPFHRYNGPEVTDASDISQFE
jgi:hypothetical protein